jgi:hypothetical protein
VVDESSFVNKVFLELQAVLTNTTSDKKAKIERVIKF